MNYIKKAMVCVAAAGAAMLASATPVVSNVTMTQGGAGRLVTITYSLTEDAVVTLDVMTNATPNAATGWASIGGAAICNAKGAVWRKVTNADADGQGKYTITWRPDLSWTDEYGKGFVIANGCAKAVVTAWALDNTPNYMVVDISAAAQPNTQRYYPAADFLPGGLLGNPDYRTTSLVMRKIMAKDVMWTMGSTPLETQREAAKEATHKVTLTNNYYMGVFEVTQAQWAQVATNSTRKAFFKTDTAGRPMEYMTYSEIRLAKSTTANATYYWPANPNPISFLGLLRTKSGLDFDLPSEAQWEFAARAGNGDMKWGNGSTILNAYSDSNLALLGRCGFNGGLVNGSSEPDKTCGTENGTATVGSYAPNDWGLYDMHGNVWEMCLDYYEADISDDAIYGGKVNIDPANPSQTLSGSTTVNRVIRGGGYSNDSSVCRPAYRSYNAESNEWKSFGFRIVCVAGLQ